METKKFSLENTKHQMQKFYINKLLNLCKDLNLPQDVIINKFLTKKEYFKYLPYANFKTNNEIRITIKECQETYTLISGSYINICGKLTTTDKVENPQCNNICASLFSEIILELNNTVIDAVRGSAILNNLKECVNASNESDSRRAENARTQSNDDTLVICIPLRELLGFAEVYNNVTNNCKIELILHKGNNTAIEINSIEWFVPHITIDETKLKLLVELLYILKKFRSTGLDGLKEDEKYKLSPNYLKTMSPLIMRLIWNKLPKHLRLDKELQLDKLCSCDWKFSGNFGNGWLNSKINCEKCTKCTNI